MLEQLSRHSLIDLALAAKGDLHIDYHHTTEDTGYVVGEAISKALGSRAGIMRYGAAMIPMDETLARVALDASNRPYLVWKVNFSRPKLGEILREEFDDGFGCDSGHESDREDSQQSPQSLPPVVSTWSVAWPTLKRDFSMAWASA